MVKQERQRYIYFKIIKEEDLDLDEKTFLKSIWQSIWRYFGMKEANKIGLWLFDLDLANGSGILRCSHDTKEILITALSLIREINGKRVIFSALKTSGTIKGIKRKMRNNNKE